MLGWTFRTRQPSPAANRPPGSTVRALAMTATRIENRPHSPERPARPPDMNGSSHDDDGLPLSPARGRDPPAQGRGRTSPSRAPGATARLARGAPRWTGGDGRRIRTRSDRGHRTRQPHRVRPPGPSAPGDPPSPARLPPGSGPARPARSLCIRGGTGGAGVHRPLAGARSSLRVHHPRQGAKLDRRATGAQGGGGPVASPLRRCARVLSRAGQRGRHRGGPRTASRVERRKLARFPGWRFTGRGDPGPRRAPG